MNKVNMMHAHRAVLAYHLQDCSGSLRHLDLHGHAREREGEPSKFGNAKIPVAVNPKTPKRLVKRWKNLPRFEGGKIIGIYPGKNVLYHVPYKCG